LSRISSRRSVRSSPGAPSSRHPSFDKQPPPTPILTADLFHRKLSFLPVGSTFYGSYDEAMKHLHRPASFRVLGRTPERASGDTPGFAFCGRRGKRNFGFRRAKATTEFALAGGMR
jgi:hypothetical protein